jgi:hypothetical protein
MTNHEYGDVFQPYVQKAQPWTHLTTPSSPDRNVDKVLSGRIDDMQASVLEKWEEIQFGSSLRW